MKTGRRGQICPAETGATTAFESTAPMVARFYPGKTGAQTRYFFADANSSIQSDSAFHDPAARRRILDARAGNALYLNSTLYRGKIAAPQMTNVQHKIADHRNYNAGTRTSLKDEERRARVEVTLTSLDTLTEYGLNVIEDLRGFPFRTMTRDLMRFRLATCANDPESVEAAIAQMRTRGVYGVEMNQRASNYVTRER